MKAYIFPGQGAQYTGMGKNLYEKYPIVKELFKQANRILKFDLTRIMFEGSSEDLRQTKVTQPAIFLHSVALAKVLGDDFHPDMVAGHSLGEFSALVANGTLDFEDGLKLVAQRAFAMQKACEAVESTMAAVIALGDDVVEKICSQIKDDVVVAANYNCPGQVVISGSKTAIEKVTPMLKEAGAKRVLPLAVGGAFHSPLMEPARLELAEAIMETKFQQGICPIYQNVTAQPVSSIDIIRENLVSQLTSPVRWTQTIQNMAAAGTTQFVEVGPGTVLQGLVKKIAPNAEAVSVDGTL